MLDNPRVVVIGGGLAGCEASLQLAKRDIPVKLYDMKPVKRSSAHHSENLAEIVCSNSLGNLQLSTASGLLKEELKLLDCQLLKIALNHALPAGNALAVDREMFSRNVTEKIDSLPQITRISEELTEIPSDADFVIVATGPLTSPGMVETLQKIVNQEQLYFFDAAAPIVMKDSINFDRAFYQNRYNKGQHEEDSDGSYINCPLDKEQYLALVDFLLSSEKTSLKSFEMGNANFFESCLPVEVLASRGIDTLRYGPLKPVGIECPKTGKRPYAVIQLRQDNLEGTLYNMVGFQTNLKWGEQKRMIQMISGLEEAEIVRYGVMHRNTYVNSPEILLPTMQMRKLPNVLMAGQITGVEGYTESIASGLMAALTVVQLLSNKAPVALPQECITGSLFNYITRGGVKHFQPVNSNWGILPTLPNIERRVDKAVRNRQLAERSLNILREFIYENLQLGQQSEVAPVTTAWQPLC